jgi:hypothetical protein
MLQGADHAASHGVQGPVPLALRIGRPLQPGQDLVPDAGFDPRTSPLTPEASSTPEGHRIVRPSGLLAYLD